MLLLFVTMMLRELQLFSEVSPLRATHGTSRHHHCGSLHDARAQQNALAEQRHLSLHDAHRGRRRLCGGSAEGSWHCQTAASTDRERVVDELE